MSSKYFRLTGSRLGQPLGLEHLRVPRHPRLDPNVVSMDDRRIIQIFPSPSGDRTTWDGVRVKLEEGFVRLSSKTPRPLEVRVRNATIAKIERLDSERMIPLPE